MPTIFLDIQIMDLWQFISQWYNLTGLYWSIHNITILEFLFILINTLRTCWLIKVVKRNINKINKYIIEENKNHYKYLIVLDKKYIESKFKRKLSYQRT